jgi:hypothetical protein
MLHFADENPVTTYGFWPVFVLSIVVGVLALGIAFLFAGAGHGTYIPAKLFFPYTMLSTGLFGSILPGFELLAFLQFPIYGVILGIAARIQNLFYTAKVIAAVHLFFTALCLAFSGEAFS